MSTLNAKVEDFLGQQRIAVAGVSATREITGNGIYRKLKATGYQVFAVNPGAETFDGDPCYPDLKSIPGGVGGVVVVTKPAVTDEIVRQCPAAGVKRVWMHQTIVPAGSSVSQDAVEFCRQNDIAVIAGACPMMFVRSGDFGHKCMRWILRLVGGLPR